MIGGDRDDREDGGVDRADDGARPTATARPISKTGDARPARPSPRQGTGRPRETSEQTAERFATLRKTEAVRPPDLTLTTTVAAPRKHCVSVSEDVYREIAAEAKRRRMSKRGLVEFALGELARPEDPESLEIDVLLQEPQRRRGPDRRGKGRSYRAARLCDEGVPLEEAAMREGVSVPSVIRAIRCGGSRTG